MGMIFDSCIWMGLATGQIATSAVIDAAGELPVYTSALSIGELSFGVHACTDATERAMRAAYLRQVESRPVLKCPSTPLPPSKVAVLLVRATTTCGSPLKPWSTAAFC